METNSIYQKLAARLDALPNGFPPAPDGSDLHLLEKLFTPDEAALAAELGSELETPQQIADRLSQAGWDTASLRALLKGMARKGLIFAGRAEGGLGYGLMPFVVGIWEAQGGRVDADLAARFETYYRQAFRQALTIQPAFHRVVPVGESIRVDLEIRPFESAQEMVHAAQSWGVIDCICRVQKRLIGEGCDHPVDVCMVLGASPGIFDTSSFVRPLTMEGALATLQRAAAAGLVHSVSNVRNEVSYICNCCTCSCGILRGVSELGRVNVVARSAFVNTVDASLCAGCATCLDACQFGALSLPGDIVQVDRDRCVGCGVCVPLCPSDALALERRPEGDILPIPEGGSAWGLQRFAARGMMGSSGV